MRKLGRPFAQPSAEMPRKQRDRHEEQKRDSRAAAAAAAQRGSYVSLDDRKGLAREGKNQELGGEEEEEEEEGASSGALGVQLLPVLGDEGLADGLRQEVRELLERRLGEAGLLPEVRREESVRLHEAIEGGLQHRNSFEMIFSADR